MKHLKNNKGQTLTEFLFVVVLLVFLVLAHTQLSLSYVFANVIHYATFMAARAEAVQPESGALYLEAMVGTPTASKLPMVHFSQPAGNSFVVTEEGNERGDIFGRTKIFGKKTR